MVRAGSYAHLLDYHFTARWRSPASSRRRPSRRIIAAVFITITTKLPWARINSGTFADKEALIYAEIVRLDGMNSIALEQYEKAVRQFRGRAALTRSMPRRTSWQGVSLACGYPTASDAHFRGAIAARGAPGRRPRCASWSRISRICWPRAEPRGDTAAFAQNEVIRDLQSVIKAHAPCPKKLTSSV